MNGRSILVVAVVLAIAIPATAQVREYHPLLTYIFFDSASAVIPDRYHLYRSASEAASFAEADLPPNTLDIYHHLLNIIGSRMQRYPDTRIEIVGCNSMQEEIGEVIEVSRMRGEVVREYLSEIWGIDTSRLRLLPPRGYPRFRSNPKDPFGVVENRRAEILTDDWQLIQPIITYDTTQLFEPADSTLDVYTLIMFKFDNLEMGPLNKRIVREYIMGRLRKGAKVEVTGYNDVVGIDGHIIGHRNMGRVNSVMELLQREAKPGIISWLSGQGVGVTAPLHSIDTPEGRFYNRCVQVVVITPVQ